MNILITGANGFVGKNLISQLDNIKYGKSKKYSLSSDIEIMPFDIDIPIEKLDEYTERCDFVFHLAGVNRPEHVEDFMEGNFGFTSMLLDSLKKHNNKATVVITSSIQAVLDNPYGLSKKAGEDLLLRYGQETGAKVYIYRLPNVFGKWCRPNYNSAVATFCYNIAHDIPIVINDRFTRLKLVYIDDLVNELINSLNGTPTMDGQFCTVDITYSVTLGEIVDLLYSFKNISTTLIMPDVGDAFVKKLHATYLSYLPTNQFSYPLKMNIDERGSFTEIIKTTDAGQFSVNISKPHIIKGNHWHHTKNEKFVVVSGQGIIRFRKIDNNDVIEYHVSGKKMEVVDIPTGYTHNIENIGETDMVTFMWCNECFDPQNPDTYYEKV